MSGLTRDFLLAGTALVAALLLIVLLGLTVVATVEMALAEDGRLEHEGLLLAPILPDGGEQS